jgi:choline kinase
MHALILAAGMGKRLGTYTKNNTKCMLPVHGRTLIERSLDSLIRAGVESCTLVLGYKKENVIAFLGSRYKTINLSYISNDIYDATNNIYSLYLAKETLLRDDTILLESDLIFDEEIPKDLIENRDKNLALVAKYDAWMDGTVVTIDAEKDSYYKTVNIYKFAKEFSQMVFVPFLEAYISAMGKNDYYEQVLGVINNLETKYLKALVLKDQKWYEIDNEEDKKNAEKMFS